MALLAFLKSRFVRTQDKKTPPPVVHDISDFSATLLLDGGDTQPPIPEYFGANVSTDLLMFHKQRLHQLLVDSDYSETDLGKQINEAEDFLALIMVSSMVFQTLAPKYGDNKARKLVGEALSPSKSPRRRYRSFCAET